jgi:paraquat-inducible protein A
VTAPAWRVPLALAVAAACLAAGVSWPILRVSRFLVFSEPFSILDGVRALLAGGDWLIGGIVAAFSIVFPLAKIAVLFALWARLRRGDRPAARWAAVLQALGKWSMLDVFVVALVIFAVKASAFGDAATAPAIYPFLAAVALTAYAGHAVERECRRGGAAFSGRGGPTA